MTLTTYRNFDLLLTHTDTRGWAIVVDAPAATVRLGLDLRFVTKNETEMPLTFGRAPLILASTARRQSSLSIDTA